MKKRFGFLAALLVFACVLTVGALAADGYWEKNGDEWYYYNDDGSSYYGWLLDNGKWYYLAPSTGKMYANGVFMIDYKHYAFRPDGSMVTGWYQSNGQSGGWWYYFDANGQEHNGWLLYGDSWYYCDHGQMLNNCSRYINNKKYIFRYSGEMVTGWYGNSYYDANGQKCYGWLQYKNDWYYLDENGIKETGIGYVAGHTYHFDASGRLITEAGWDCKTYGEGSNSRTDWYYFDEGGKGHNGWLLYKGSWYYLSEGYMLHGNSYISLGKAYYRLGDDGRLITQAGWVSEEWFDYMNKEYVTRWYYFDANGKGVTGWFKNSHGWYYLNGGMMIADASININGRIYVFDKDGYMISDAGWAEATYSWQYVDEESIWRDRLGGTFYLNADGTAMTGWQKMGDDWYYFEPDTGIMATEAAFVNGYMYYFDDDGRWDGNAGVWVVDDQY